MSDDQDQELGITVQKKRNMSEWYTQVVKKAGLADYAPVKGCMVIRPYGMKIWERIQDIFDSWIEDEVDNAYFPMFIPEKLLNKEKEFLDGFDPELAVVSAPGDDHKEDGERIALRPSSESIITPFMAKWVRSHRDLPLRLNQWCNVVRWEATDTRPFLRTREFLWQEGHTAHADEDGARTEMRKRLDQYQELYEEIFGIPVLQGKKPEHDKFPGAVDTTTVEALMPDGKSIQGATSHYLGTHFAEAFDLDYEDANQETNFCHTASWGLSTRSIGALIMAHGDDDGLILPPEIAPIEVVIVPIYTGDKDESVKVYADELDYELDAFRTECDTDAHRTPGFKFNKWELKGVPLRIEVGPNELEENTVTLARRDTGEKEVVDKSELQEAVEDALEEIQINLYRKLEKYRDEHIAEADSYKDILRLIGKQRGYVKTAWCGDESCEEKVKDQVHAEIVLVPFDEDVSELGAECSICGDEATEVAYFAKNY